MLIGEPPRSQYDWNFTIGGFPVRVHPYFWLLSVLLGAQQGGLFDLLAWVGVVFVSILVHELGHALAMRHFGKAPRIVLHAMGGLAIADSYFHSYSNRGRADTSRNQIIISAAGPAAGFLLAGLVIALLYASNRSMPFFFGWQFGEGLMINPRTQPGFFVLVWDLLFVNIMWGLMNLFPVYPLDGGQIAREILTAVNPHEGIKQSLVLSIVAAAGLALYGLVQWRQPFLALLFGYLAYTSYATLQAYTGGGRFGGGGSPW